MAHHRDIWVIEAAYSGTFLRHEFGRGERKVKAVPPAKELPCAYGDLKQWSLTEDVFLIGKRGRVWDRPSGFYL